MEALKIPCKSVSWSSCAIGVNGELAVLPSRQAAASFDPQTAVARSQQTKDPVAGQVVSLRRTPRNELHSIESEQATLAPNPELPIFCLCDCQGRAQKISFSNTPGGIPHLGELKVRIKRARPGTPGRDEQSNTQG